MELVQNAHINGMIRSVLILFLLYILSVEDIRSRTLTIRKILLFGTAGTALFLISDGRDIPAMLSGAAIGAVLVLISAATGGKIGLGDGLVILFIGLTAGFGPTFMMVFAAFLLGSIYGLVMMIVKKRSRDTEYPFMPFLLVSFVGLQVL